MKTLFEHDKYRDFLRQSFPGSGERRGQRRKLAETLNCQTSFISLVLTDRAHINEDMLFLAARFLGLNAEETDFLLLIYHFERAGTSELRQYYRSKIKSFREKRNQIKSRINSAPTMPIEVQAQYYSNWVYSAIHTAVMSVNTRSIEKISKKLDLSERLTEEVLSFLTEWGFVTKKSQVYEPGVNRLHLDSSSPFILQHHRNWHQEAIRNLNEKQEEDFNYSGALSLAKSDIPIVREIFLKSISLIEKQITPSPDEEMIGISVSCFKY